MVPEVLEKNLATLTKSLSIFSSEERGCWQRVWRRLTSCDSDTSVMICASVGGKFSSALFETHK